MKRRELLKTGLAAMGASTIALSGCSKKEAQVSDDINIIPKQTAQYEISAPLPFDFKAIDEISELNSGIKKSQVKILYNNIPRPLVNKYHGCIHVIRGMENPEIKTFNDFTQYAKHAIENGFEFTYLMNSPKGFSEKEFSTFKDDFLYILDSLKNIGCKNIKVGNNQVIDLINK